MFDLFRSREKSMKYLLTAVLSVVALSMVITLVPGITNPVPSNIDDQNVIAKVCGVSITGGEIRRQIDDYTRNGQLPASMIAGYLPTIIDGHIKSEALACIAAEKGMDISDEDLAAEIRNAMPNLVNAQGVFDKASYEMTLQRMGMTVPVFEERMKQQLLYKRMQDMATDGIIIPVSEVKKEYELRNVKIKLEYASVTAASLAGEVHPDEAEVEAFFKASPGKYMLPAKREYTVVYADQEQIGATLTVDDAQLRAAYNQQIDSFRTPERVKVRHILITTTGLNDAQKKDMLTKTQGILKRVKAGEDFGKLAKEFSEDPGSKDKGGEYDFTPRGQWVKPFEDAAFSLKPMEISDIVTTDYGYHIIQPLAHEQARVRPFEEVKGQLVNEVQKAKVQEAMQKAIDGARAEATKNPGQLEEIAAKYHLGVVKSGGKLKANQPMPVLGTAPELVTAIFATKLGQLTTVTQPQAGKLAFARVDGIEDARPAEFNDVKPQVMTAYKAKKADEIAQAKVKEAAAKLAAGEDFKSVAKFLGTEPKTSNLIGRNEAIEGVGDANAFAELFSKPVGAVVGPLNIMGQMVLAKSLERQEPSADQFESNRDSILKALRQRISTERLQLFEDSVLQNLTDKGKIKRNQKAIDALLQSYLR